MTRQFKCRQPGCPNYYDEVVGGEGWGAKPGRGQGDCMPCWIAATIRASPGATLDSVAANAQFREMTEHVLARGGWGWADLEQAYHRVPPPVIM